MLLWISDEIFLWIITFTNIWSYSVLLDDVCWEKRIVFVLCQTQRDATKLLLSMKRLFEDGAFSILFKKYFKKFIRVVGIVFHCSLQLCFSKKNKKISTLIYFYTSFFFYVIRSPVLVFICTFRSYLFTIILTFKMVN